MDRQEYIDYLVDQGYSEEEIVKALQSKDFTKIETDPPKKTTDPLKQETSLGSLKNTVFKQEDGSSELSESEAEALTPFIGNFVEDKDEFNKIGKDFGYWNEKLDRVLKVELNDRESEAISLIESVNRGEGEYGRDLFRRYEENEKEVESDFENKEETTSTLIMSPGFSMGGSMVANTYKSKTKRAQEVSDYIDRARKELQEGANEPTENQILQRAKQLSLEDKNKKSEIKVKEQLVSDMEGYFDPVTFLGKFTQGEVGKIRAKYLKSGERAEFASALRSAQAKINEVKKEETLNLKQKIGDSYTLGYVLEKLEKKYGSDTSKWPEEVLESYKKGLQNYHSNYQEIKQGYSDLDSTFKNLGSFEEEIDLASREYDALNVGATKLAASIQNLEGQAFGLAELVVDVAGEVSGFDMEENTILGEVAKDLITGAEELRKGVARNVSVSDIENPADLLRWTGDLLVDQAPQLGLNYATGGGWAGLAMIGGLAGGGKYIETLDDESLSQRQRFIASIGVGIAETLSEKVTSNIFLRNFPAARANKAAFAGATEIVQNELKQEFKNGVSQGVKRSFNILQGAKRAGKRIFIDTQEEGLSEVAAQIAGNFLDKRVLGKENVNLLDGVEDAYLSGAVIGGIISTAPSIGSEVISPFVNDPERLIPRNLKKMNDLVEQGYKAKDYRTRKLINDQIKELKNQNARAIMGGMRTLYGLSAGDIREGHDIYRQLQEVKNDYDAVLKDKGLNETERKQQLEVLNKRYNILQKERNAIIEKGNEALENAFKYENRLEAVKNILKPFANIEFMVAKNDREARQLAEKYDPDFADTRVELDGYIIRNPKTGEQRIIINEQVALRNERINVAGHELLHGVLYATVRNNLAGVKGLEQALRAEIDKIDKSILKEGEFKDRLDLYKEKFKPEETLTLFFDAIAEGSIKLNETKLQKFGSEIRRVLQNVPGFRNIDFKETEDVLRFIKDFNTSVERGRLTTAQKRLARQGAKGELLTPVVSQPPSETQEETEPAQQELAIAASKSKKPRAIFMIGGPGAGKTNVGKGLKLGRRGFKVVNQDIALEAMKEEAGLPAEEAGYTAEQRSLRSKLGAAAVKAAKEKFNQYVSNKNDMVIDGTGASYNATMKKVKELEDAGFDVSMVVANTPLQTALERNRARKERSLADNIVVKTYDQVQQSLAKYREDFGDKLYEINTESIKYGEDLPQDFLDTVYKGIGVDTTEVMASKSTVLEEINNLVPDNVTTKEDFTDPRVFNEIYNATAFPGGVINNYIRSRTSSTEEAQAATESVVDRLIAFDPQAKRADGSTVGIEGFGEFIFANTAFGKLDAKKKLFEESQRKAKETRIDESTKQIADVEEQVFTQEEVGIKEKPTINPLKFTGVPGTIALSKKPEGKPTFKTITKQYAGEVGEQAIGIPAKKITESAANLGSVNEARAIQQFFFKADNLDKFVKILPEFNIALPETQIGLETLDAPRDVKGTGLGLPKRILDYFYEDFIDPTGKLTSPKGRSKGLTSQVPVKRLKPEFRGVVAKETIDKIKSDIGITPKGELNILPKGELRSPIGQLLKGMAKTYSSLAANTLVRQEMGASNFAKEDIARAAAGKQEVMASATPRRQPPKQPSVRLRKVLKRAANVRSVRDVIKVLEEEGVNVDKELILSDSKTFKGKVALIERKQKTILDTLKNTTIGVKEFINCKFANFGMMRAYGYLKDGKFIEYTKQEVKQLESKGIPKYQFKFAKLKNGDWVQVPKKIKNKETGKFNANKKAEAEFFEKYKNELLPERQGSYWGVEDPKYKEALAVAKENDAKSKNKKKSKRVKYKEVGTEYGIKQGSENLEYLGDMLLELNDAVRNGSIPPEAFAIFTVSAYQATEGAMKAGAPFKYIHTDPKYAVNIGKSNQQEGELSREEHASPASKVGAQAIVGVFLDEFESVWNDISKNYYQELLSKDEDVVLDYAKLDASGVEGTDIGDPPIIRKLAANIITEDLNIKELARININKSKNIATGKTQAEEVGIVLAEEFQTKDNLNLQSKLALSKVLKENPETNITDERILSKIKPYENVKDYQAYLNESIKLNSDKALQLNKAKAPVTEVMASNSNKQLLNNLNNYDKALRNARNNKAPVKGISVFDFDDTLATSESKVIVNMPASEVQKITGTGDATKIIRTVYDGAVSLISKKKEIKKLNFAADFSEPSRVKLYNTLAKKLEKELGWDLDVFEEFTFGKKTQEDFELTRPEGAKDVKPRDSDLEFTENEIGGFEASFNIDDKQYNVYVDFRGEGDYDLSFKLVEESETFEITPEEFAKRGEELLEQGAEFDFTQFSQVIDGKPGPLIAKLDKAIKKFGNKDVFILTARPANSATAIHEFLKGLGYNIPLENITGLANSSPEAKAQWMVDKAAEGYNDFYFADDAYKNVKAVQDAMKVLDVKSKERMVYKDRYDKLDKEMNDILEAKTGIAAEKEYSKAKAEVVGAGKGRFKFFIPPSADDFVGLLYSTLAKGKLGDNQMAWYKKNLLDPYARAMNNISSERVALAADYKALKKQLGIVPKNLRKKIKGEGFTKEQAVRMYIWNKQDMNIPGLSKTDLEDMVKFVENDASLQVFADQLIEINKGDGYPAPKEYWLSGSITTDLMDGLGGTKRAKHLEEWQQNVDVIFSEKNLNKMEAAYGRPYREAMENMLERMKSGKNRNYNGDSTTGRMLDWLNGSIGAIMFLNTRSAVLQTLSAVNFINFKDNNILAAGKAFANQPQYWKDFKELFNSDFLKERREGMNINVNEADIADMAKRGGAKGAISYLLQLGFTPTQIADSFAIASGGATFYRNRIKTYVKAGMPEAQAKEKAFLDFRETAEESQQSSRPDRISKQQAGPLGRVVLAFANTPSQYARIIKKAGQDLAARRGSAVSNISKIIYYGAVQGFIFNAIQQALFAADMEDEEEMEEKYVRLANGMADGVLRGMGVSGAATAVVKNSALRVYNESQKDRPKYEKVAFELTKLSPPISSKLSRINQAAREVQWNADEMKQKGFSLDNPAWLAAGNVISATTNIPVDRAIKKVNNVKDAFDQDLAMYERMALLSGWQSWELGIDKKKKEKIESGEIQYEDIQYEDIQYEDIELED